MENIKELMEFGFERMKPHINEMTNIMKDCYKQGFKDCWKILTGKEF